MLAYMFVDVYIFRKVDPQCEKPTQRKLPTTRCKLTHTLLETGSHGVSSHTHAAHTQTRVLTWENLQDISTRQGQINSNKLMQNEKTWRTVGCTGCCVRDITAVWQHEVNAMWHEATWIQKDRTASQTTPKGPWSEASRRLWVTADGQRRSLSLMLTCLSCGGGCHLSVSRCSWSTDQRGIWGPCRSVLHHSCCRRCSAGGCWFAWVLAGRCGRCCRLRR